MRRDNRKRVISILNFDDIYAKSINPIILDKQFDFSKPGYADALAEHLFSRSSDIDFVARCECGHLEGNYYVDYGRPVICPVCQTTPTTDMEAATGHLRFQVFLSCPEKIVNGWLNPAIYRILARWLTYSEAKRKINLLDNLLDNSVPMLPDFEGIVPPTAIRGFSYFYHNFEYFMEYFLTQHRKTSEQAKTDPRTGLSQMRYFLQMYRDRIWCHYLPLMASALHPIIAEGHGPNRKRYVDKNTLHVLSAASGLSYLRFSPRQSSLQQRVVEETAFTAYKEHIAYLEDISTKQISKKKSLPRRHIFGARMHLTFRGVIVPIFGDHEFDELYLPWQIAVNLLRDPIIGRLVRRHNLSIGAAMHRHATALQIYDPLIHAMMNDFIAECPYKGLPVLFGRNPSLKRGSIQLLFVTKIKPEVYDKSIEISVLVIRDPNADFDGDEMYGVLLTEMDAVEKFMVLHPANRVLSTNETGYGDTMDLPKEAAIVANTFLGEI